MRHFRQISGERFFCLIQNREIQRLFHRSRGFNHIICEIGCKIFFGRRIQVKCVGTFSHFCSRLNIRIEIIETCFFNNRRFFYRCFFDSFIAAKLFGQPIQIIAAFFFNSSRNNRCRFSNMHFLFYNWCTWCGCIGSKQAFVKEIVVCGTACLGLLAVYQPFVIRHCIWFGHINFRLEGI